MDKLHESMIELSFPYYEINEFKLKDRLGAGYIGEVFTGELKLFDDSIDCIIKKLSSVNYRDGSKDMIYQDLLDEVNIGQRFMCMSKHLIQYYGYSVNVKGEEVNLYLLMEKTIAEGDITSYIYKDKFWKPLTKEVYNKSKSNTLMYHNNKYWDYIMPTRERLKIMKQMAIAISDLHKFKVVHCDLKPHNMLLVGDRVKLIDFNAIREFSE